MAFGFLASGVRRIVDVVRRVEGTPLPLPASDKRTPLQRKYLVKSSDDVLQGGTGTFTIYTRSSKRQPKGEESGTGKTLTGYARLRDYHADTWAYAEWYDGGWEIYSNLSIMVGVYDASDGTITVTLSKVGPADERIVLTIPKEDYSFGSGLGFALNSQLVVGLKDTSPVILLDTQSDVGTNPFTAFDISSRYLAIPYDFDEGQTLLVKRTGNVTAGSTAEFDVYDDGWSLRSPSVSLTVLVEMGDYTSGKKGYAKFIEGKWRLIATEC